MAEQPKRIQMSRQHPWRTNNPDAVRVDRRTKWGNPFAVVRRTKASWDVLQKTTQGDLWLASFVNNKYGHEAAVCDAIERMAAMLERDALTVKREEIRAALAGKDLACWCPLDQPCHADVLLEIANAVLTPTLVLDVYGPADAREEATDEVLAVVSVPVKVRHHRRPWKGNVLKPTFDVPVIPITRGQRWANLSVIAASFFVLGVVVWNLAVGRG